MNRIALLRKEKKLNQKELGAIIGVAQNTICNWENEKREPDQKSLREMATFFHCSIDYLLGQEDTSEKEQPTPVSESGPTPEFIQLYERLSDDEKSFVIRQIKGLLSEE